MTATDAVGTTIDWLWGRRYGAPYSAKWWAREHQHHESYVTLACPLCPDAEELGCQMLLGPVKPMSFNDFRAAAEAQQRAAVEGLDDALTAK